MNAEQILKLIEAGYTKAEIDAMAAPAAPAEEVKEEGPAPAEEVKEDQPAPAETAASETDKRLDRIESIIEKMAAHGIAASSAPEPPEKKNVVAEILEHL